MLKKLRLRFVANNMLLVGIIIVTVFAGVFIVSLVYERQQSIDAITSVLNKTGGIGFLSGDLLFDERGFTGGGPEEAAGRNNKTQTVKLVVVTDEKGNVITAAMAPNVSVDDDLANMIVRVAIKSDDDSGVINGYALRYVKMPTAAGGYKIGYADISSEMATMSFMFRICVFSAVFILSIMFLISDYMAHKSIAPIEKSWNNQNRFVADASHELKTPLTVILANMDIMLANPDSTVEEQKKWIDNTKSEAKRMTQLVNDMLFLAKSDAAIEQSYNFQPVNLSSVAEDCVLTFESVAFEKGMKLVSEIAPDLYVDADEAKIKQVMMIILDNALKYTDPKGVIAASLQLTGRNIRFAVLNSGQPIPMEKQPQIFERFFRADESRVREQGGYGLGLSIAKNIIETHKGRIELEYSDERGTCFSFTLPSLQNTSKKHKAPQIERGKE